MWIFFYYFCIRSIEIIRFVQIGTLDCGFWHWLACGLGPGGLATSCAHSALRSVTAERFSGDRLPFLGQDAICCFLHYFGGLVAFFVQQVAHLVDAARSLAEARSSIITVVFLVSLPFVECGLSVGLELLGLAVLCRLVVLVKTWVVWGALKLSGLAAMVILMMGHHKDLWDIRTLLSPLRVLCNCHSWRWLILIVIDVALTLLRLLFVKNRPGRRVHLSVGLHARGKPIDMPKAHVRQVWERQSHLVFYQLRDLRSVFKIFWVSPMVISACPLAFRVLILNKLLLGQNFRIFLGHLEGHILVAPRADGSAVEVFWFGEGWPPFKSHRHQKLLLVTSCWFLFIHSA